jgi:hypothetical protein
MPLYFFRVQSGRFSGAEDRGTDLADNDAAWDELRRVAGDLLGSICRKLKPDSKWQIELLDGSNKPIFKITLVGETLEKSPG